MKVNIMPYKRGDTCFIMNDSPEATQVKVVGKQGATYLVQLIGSCGALKLSEDKLFATKEEAEESIKAPAADVKVQLSDIPTPGVNFTIS